MEELAGKDNKVLFCVDNCDNNNIILVEKKRGEN